MGVSARPDHRRAGADPDRPRLADLGADRGGIGLRPHLADRVQPIVQFLAAFPANLFFPVAVVLILRFRLNPEIWLSPLMILGTQWYILFNVIVGTTALPLELQRGGAESRRQAAACGGGG